MLLLNLGCGDTAPANWVNVDYAWGARIAKSRVARRLTGSFGLLRTDWPTNIVIHDLRKPLPVPDGSVDGIYCSHVLEHFTRQNGARLLSECSRVLAPGGTIRIIVPDFSAIVDSYLAGTRDARDVVDALGVSDRRADDGHLKQLMAPVFRFPHRCMYDGRALVAALEDVGLHTALERPFRGSLPHLQDVERIERVSGLIAEGRKK